MLNFVPLFTSFIGVLFLAMIIVNRGALRQNRPAWLILMAIVLLAIHTQVDAYLYYNGYRSPLLGFSFLHIHLMGGLFLFFTRFLLGVPVNSRFRGMMRVGRYLGHLKKTG